MPFRGWFSRGAAFDAVYPARPSRFIRNGGRNAMVEGSSAAHRSVYVMPMTLTNYNCALGFLSAWLARSSVKCCTALRRDVGRLISHPFACTTYHASNVYVLTFVDNASVLQVSNELIRIRFCRCKTEAMQIRPTRDLACTICIGMHSFKSQAKKNLLYQKMRIGCF